MSFPTERIDALAVHEFALRAVGFTGVEGDFALVADNLANRFSNLADGDVFPKTHIDVAEHGLGMLVVGGLIQVHDMHAGSGHVIDVQEFAFRGASAPDGYAGRIVDLGFMEAAYESRDDV